jgi:branched-chain amino acid transport system ATP-binding protein
VQPADATTLEASGIHVHFEGVRAVDGVDLSLRQHEILGLIGPNGAGKTTLVNALSGFQPLTQGRVRLAGVEVTEWPPHRRAGLGLGRTFQNVRLFPAFTVLENIEAGGAGVGLRRARARAQALDLIERLRLADVADLDASALSQGQERRLGIARALAARPTFLLLDEPAAGLNEHESEDLASTLVAIRDDHGLGLLLIEHDMRVIMSICDRIQVLDYGKTIAIGTAAEVRTHPAVIAAYLGEPADVS